MNIILTKHAKKRLRERGIKISWIRETVEMPEYVVKKDNKKETHKRVGNKFLKVVYIKEDNFIKIISVMWK